MKTLLKDFSEAELYKAKSNLLIRLMQVQGELVAVDSEITKREAVCETSPSPLSSEQS